MKASEIGKTSKNPTSWTDSLLEVDAGNDYTRGRLWLSLVAKPEDNDEWK